MLMVDGECLSSEDSLRADHHIHLRLRSGIELIPTSTADLIVVESCHQEHLCGQTLRNACSHLHRGFTVLCEAIHDNVGTRRPPPLPTPDTMLAGRKCAPMSPL
jgi:hypothetical protein